MYSQNPNIWGHDGGGFLRIKPDGTQVISLGDAHGRLIPYKGPYDDARLAQYNLNQMFPTCKSCDAKIALHDQLLDPAYQTAFSKIFQRDVRWKVQFGNQLVYFGHDKGLRSEEADKWTNRRLNESQLTSVIDGPCRSSFAAREFESLQSVVRFVEDNMNVEEISHQHILRFTEKAYQWAICYERSASTREAVLDNQVFQPEAFQVEARCGNFVFLLPEPESLKNADDYLLIRAHVIEPKVPAMGVPQRDVRVEVTRGQIIPRFLNEITHLHEIDQLHYTRLQERHVLRGQDSPVEIHVMSSEEYGATVTQRGAKIRVELHCQPTQPSQDDWEWFIATAMRLAELLPRID